jgi:predicted CoA-binding protein
MKNQVNKSQLFRNAWTLVKTAGKTMSQALKAAWAQAKNGTLVQDLKRQLEVAFISYYPTAEKASALSSVKSLTYIVTSGFAFEVCQTVLKYRKCSEKQAYVIAKAMAENNFTTI